MQHKILGYVFIAIAVLAIISGIYYWQVTDKNSDYVQPVTHTDPTADWKSYRFEQYGLEFKYPKGYDLASSDYKVITFVYQDHQVSQIYIRSKTIAENIEATKNLILSDGGKILKETKKIINGQEVTQIIAYSPQEGPNFSVHNYVLANEKVYEIIFVAFEENMPYDEILSTFKFINQTTGNNGEFCGGIAGILCPDGYSCKYDGDYPDAGGVCVANPKNNNLLKVCPEEWIVDAMPGIGSPNPNDPPKEYFIYKDARRELIEFDVDWIKANCNIEPLYAY